MATFVDLFSGCGGFSEGFIHEGFNPLLHVDFDLPCCETLRNRLKGFSQYSINHDQAVLHGDLTKEETISQIIERTKGKEVDVLVGGPPCQSFSTVGRAQDPNSMKNDPRNYLFKSLGIVGISTENYTRSFPMIRGNSMGSKYSGIQMGV